MTNTVIKQAIEEHQAAVESFFESHSTTLIALASEIVKTIHAGNKILICGNGGSASDALHIAAEFVGRFVDNRAALPAIALCADSAAITAIGNDYGFDHIYARQVEALGWEGDMLIAISTSGSSPNVVQAIGQAKGQGLRTALLTGQKGHDKRSYVDYSFVVPSTVTARVQEVHIILLHLLIDLVERELF